MSTIQEKLKHIHKVVGDGNCLLRAIGLQVNKSHTELRNCLYHEYIDMKEYYAPFFENIDDYAEHIKNEHIWCGEEDIAALANIIGANIELYMNDITELYMTYPCRQKSDDVVGVVYVHGNHYDAVLRDWLFCDFSECDSYAIMNCNKCQQNFCSNCDDIHICIPVPKSNNYVNDLATLMAEERMAMIGIETERTFWEAKNNPSNM